VGRIRIYAAISVDGFIADAAGSVDWLDAYPAEPVLFGRFIEDVGTIVCGRATYENGRNRGWPAGPRTIVLTSRPLDAAPNVETRPGPVGALIDELRERDDARDVWLMGGGRLLAAFLDADAVDQIIVFIVPHVLGSGVPLFDGLMRARRLRFVSAGPHGDAGIIRLIYEPIRD